MMLAKYLNNQYDSLYMKDNDLNKISNLCNEINGKEIFINNAGHFNEKYGNTKFKELLELI